MVTSRNQERGRMDDPRSRCEDDKGSEGGEADGNPEKGLNFSQELQAKYKMSAADRDKYLKNM